jgi:hypothetical protein
MREIWPRRDYAARIEGTRVIVEFQREEVAAKYRAMAAAFYEDHSISARRYCAGLCAR